MSEKQRGAPSDKVVAGLFGIAGTLLGSALTLLTVGWVESQKALEQRRAEAAGKYVEAAWGPDDEAARLAHIRALSLLSVYGSPEVLAVVRDYGVSGCAPKTDEACKRKWATVVQALRQMVGETPVPDEVITQTVWGE
ncbi:MAG TPA: hypothetical protein VKA21_13740 [Candidatus Binatia bacterium]|nr:hypothetical protein [Candidatus Binatia bacterium]